MAVEDDGLRRRIGGSAGWVVAERWGSRALSLAVFAMLARLVSPESFGTVALATAIVATLQAVVDAGFAKSLVQARRLGPDDASTMFWLTVAISLVVYGGLFVLAPHLGAWLGNSELPGVLRAVGVVLPLLALSQVPAALLERELSFKPLSVRQLVGSVCGAAIAIPVALAGLGVWALVAQMVVGAMVAAIVLWSSTQWRPTLTFSVRSLRRHSRVGLSVLGTQLLDSLQANLDKVVIGVFFDAAVLGYYFIAQRLVTILVELIGAVISRVALSTFSRVQGDLERLTRIYRLMSFIAGVAAVPILGLTAAFGPQVLGFLFGPGWGPSVGYLAVLSAVGIFTSIMYFDRTALLATGNVRPMVWIVVLQNLLSVLMLLLLLPLGMIGVLLAQWARVLTWPVRLALLSKYVALNPRRYIVLVIRVLLPFVPVLIVIVLLQQTTWAQSDVAFVAFALPLGSVAFVAYGAIAWAWAPQDIRAGLSPVAERVRRVWKRKRPRD
ncbi:lipopolysaccharide biosynthesis protein [Microbacterium xanthum]|uniref:lipopolysaccharide biosynthesis protein n=1 Tax=Microbacterium xanthum TaxID=3079794 RepID=UPI002AD51A12|nr:lipopolysaccharide biosynthesis protein [Microbacterium sp. KSW-48]MDZ8170741.1 lipopolysaccharide biosynthesis protein [Microbacterium sp. KSW-48]